MRIASVPACDKCVNNTYVRTWRMRIDVDVDLHVCYPQWEKNNANASTITAWNGFAEKVELHEYKHYENYVKYYGAVISKYSGKEWHIRVCFGPDGHEKAKEAIEQYRVFLKEQYDDDWQKARAERAVEDENVENHPEYGRAVVSAILSSTTVMTSDNP